MRIWDLEASEQVAVRELDCYRLISFTSSVACAINRDAILLEYLGGLLRPETLLALAPPMAVPIL